MNILLTFAGNRDPYNPETIKGVFTDGPVLTLLAEMPFELIHIFTTPNTLANAQKLQQEIIKRTNESRAMIQHFEIADPTDYEVLFLHMSQRCQSIMDEHQDKNPVYYIAMSSGTPQMQTIWFLLNQSGLVPGKLFKVTPRRFLQPRQKAVAEIRFSLQSFPQITLPNHAASEIAATFLRKEKLEAERNEIIREFSNVQLVGKSLVMQKLLDTIKIAAAHDSSVLINGETGVGKELIAKAIHFNSARKNEPLIIVNCAAIPETLVESELFGHEKGAFTGATQQKKGKFELSDGGSIFLDEIGDMPLAAQAKILRVLQDREIMRVGGDKTIHSDVRIIAATNRNLPKSIAEGKFRQDLYYRLNVIGILAPPLRERMDDIPLLVDYFLDRHNSLYRKRKQFCREAIRQILAYNWPGNIRELENTVERAFVFAAGNVIRESDLPPEIFSPQSHLTCRHKKENSDANPIIIPSEGLDLDAKLNDLEKRYFEEAVRMKDGNREAAARLLGIKPHTFRKRAKEKFRI